MRGFREQARPITALGLLSPNPPIILDIPGDSPP